MTSLYRDKPKIAVYKTEISRCSGVITQLELDLGDRPSQMLDWSDGVLAVLLHGASGPRFSEKDCKLGALMLAFPDTSYLNWTLRLDLHDLAMFGNAKKEEVRSSYGDHQQEDRVVVKRRQNKKAVRSNG